MKKKRPSIWSKDYVSPYGKYKGPRGTPEQWQAAFQARFSDVEIKEIIGEDDPWAILGLRVGASQEQIVSAFRKKVMETHPDRNPQLKGHTGPFRRVKAAYDSLRSK